MVTAKVARQDDKDAGTFGLLTKQAEGIIGGPLRTVLNSGHAEQAFNRFSQLANRYAGSEGSDKVHWFEVFVVLKNGSHQPLPGHDVANQCVQPSFGLHRPIGNHRAKVLAAVAASRGGWRVQAEK
jgi:hypothetical protein